MAKSTNQEVQDAPEREWPKMDISEEINNMSLDEIEEFEDHTGIILTAMKGGVPAKAIKYIMFIAARRTMPDLTLEEVGKRTIGDMGGAVLEEEDNDHSEDEEYDTLNHPHPLLKMVASSNNNTSN